MQKTTLTNHLIEARQRLIHCLAFLLFSFIISYLLVEDIYRFLLEPLFKAYGSNSDKRIIYTGIGEAFITYIRLAFTSAIFFSTPFFITQFYLFIAPALYKKEKKIVLPLLITSPLLFLLGAILLYYFVFPLAFNFFISFESSNSLETLPIELEARISEYLSFITTMVFGFGIAFQLPIILILLVKIGLINSESLKAKRKYWILLIFILAAILTPPDILSQICLATPMILLYEIAVVISTKIKKS